MTYDVPSNNSEGGIDAYSPENLRLDGCFEYCKISDGGNLRGVPTSANALFIGTCSSEVRLCVGFFPARKGGLRAGTAGGVVFIYSGRWDTLFPLDAIGVLDLS